MPPFPNPQVIPAQSSINVPPSQTNTPKRPTVLTYFVIADIILYGLAFFALYIYSKAILFIVPLASIFYVSEFFFWKGKKWAWIIRQMFLGIMGAGFPIGTAYFVIVQLILNKQDVKDYFGSGPKFIYPILGLALLILAVVGIFLNVNYSLHSRVNLYNPASR